MKRALSRSAIALVAGLDGALGGAAQERDPPHLRDRGTGISTSQFGIPKSESLCIR
jgi:hypothetical protein